MTQARPISLSNALRRPAPSRRGAISRGCLVGLVAGVGLLLLLVIVGMTVAGKFNQIKAGHVTVEKKWAEIDN